VTVDAIDLNGLIDSHVHADPEHVPRLLDDLSLARQAHAAGMIGIVIKSHTALTADRASIAKRAVPGIHVWGGLTLNRSVGGLNPAAVETALAYGAAEIWMPTIDAANHRRHHNLSGPGLTIWNEERHVSEEVHEILNLIAQNDVVLGTGHLDVKEILALVRAAREHGVQKLLITHPEAPFVAMPTAIQRGLVREGVRFERTWVFTTPALGAIMRADALIDAIRTVGIESTVMATDMGQVGNPSPVEGLTAYVRACLSSGLSTSDIRWMGGDSIREWLPA
jgi:Family of unknown function (DUF6282)